mmetsp:Transcript_1860/g.2974  ORF Transcript_1860/g.2974 Transcript_1860/m.2974 type:complete len:227 (-) Transcript_1860:64-744(-)
MTVIQHRSKSRMEGRQVEKYLYSTRRTCKTNDRNQTESPSLFEGYLDRSRYPRNHVLHIPTSPLMPNQFYLAMPTTMRIKTPAIAAIVLIRALITLAAAAAAAGRGKRNRIQRSLKSPNLVRIKCLKFLSQCGVYSRGGRRAAEIVRVVREISCPLSIHDKEMEKMKEKRLMDLLPHHHHHHHLLLLLLLLPLLNKQPQHQLLCQLVVAFGSPFLRQCSLTTATAR